jgi:L-ascorbate metabolism protein UlaG (beta-lactamase superfamily)
VRITKYGHACLLVEDGDARLLLDPGAFSAGFEELTGLTAVLITHQHPDHVDLDKLPALLERNPEAVLHTDEGTAEQLAGRGLPARAVHEGDVLDLGTRVRVVGRDHAVIHPDIPGIPNTGFLVAERFLHPGDALTVPDAEVEVLGLPTGAPWLKAAEAVDYLRAVRPRVAVPIHEAVLSMPEIVYGLVDQLKPEATTLRVIDGGEPADF